MRLATIHGLLLLFSLFAAGSSVALDGALPSFSMSEVERGMKHSCVVLFGVAGRVKEIVSFPKVGHTSKSTKHANFLVHAPDSDKVEGSQCLRDHCDAVDSGTTLISDASDKNYAMRPLLHHLLQVALATSDIPIGTFAIDDFRENSNVHLSISRREKFTLGSILVLDRKEEDRTCLMKSAIRHTEYTGSVYNGPQTPEMLLDFINSRCFTFWQMDGSLGSKGLKEKKILEDLKIKRNSSLPSSVSGFTMGDLVEHCGPDLQNFFLTGKCIPNKNRFCAARECDNNDTENSVKTPKHLKIVELPRCKVIDYTPTREEFLSKWVFQSEPVIFRKAILKWPAFSKWTNSFFRQTFGNEKVHIKLTPPKGDFEGVESRSLWNVSSEFEIPQEVEAQLQFPDLVMVRPEGVDMNFSTFLDLIEKKSNQSSFLSAYLEYTPLQSYMKELEKDVEELSFVKSVLKLQFQNMWLSDGNTLGKLHMDQYDNLLCQVSGRKQLILFHPFDNRRMYEGHIVEATLRYVDGVFHRDSVSPSTAMTMAPLDIHKPDLTRFPEFGKATPLNCTIEGGDVVYVPSFWWHEVQSFPHPLQRRNLALNFWYSPFLDKEFPCPHCPLRLNPLYKHLL